jgi:hypothetical protein
MTRFENFCVQCLLGFLLMLVVAACGPGSTGTGTGPFATVGAVPGANLGPAGILTGLNFIARDVSGSWTDSDGTVLTISDQSITLRQGCNSFSFSGAWATSQTDLAQVSGTYVQLPSQANNNVARNEPAVLRLSVPTAGRLAIEVIDSRGVAILRINVLTKTSVTTNPSVCS